MTNWYCVFQPHSQPFMAPGQSYPTQTIFTQPVAQPTVQAPPPAPESSTNTTLLSETRQQTTEVRLELTKLTTKIEEMGSKVCLFPAAQRHCLMGVTHALSPLFMPA